MERKKTCWLTSLSGADSELYAIAYVFADSASQAIKVSKKLVPKESSEAFITVYLCEKLKGCEPLFDLECLDDVSLIPLYTASCPGEKNLKTLAKMKLTSDWGEGVHFGVFHPSLYQLKSYGVSGD